MTGPTTTVLVDKALCGIKGCTERAFSLFAWPGRNPVPLCRTCRTKIVEVVNKMLNGEIPEWSPAQWLSWIKEHGKDHLFRRDV